MNRVIEDMSFFSNESAEKQQKMQSYKSKI